MPAKGGRGRLPGSFFHAAGRWITTGLLDRGTVESRFEAIETRARFLQTLHLVAAMFWCFFSLWPTTYVEYAGAPLVFMLLVRAIQAPRLVFGFLTQPLFVAVALYWSWQAVTLRWSPDLNLGVRQFGCVRWMWALPALWPVMSRRRWLIATLVAGFLAGNVAQVLYGAGMRTGWLGLVGPRPPGRDSGWWDPVLGGTMLTAALGLHLPAAAWATGRWRATGVAGMTATFAGIIATGSRGAWIAGTLLVITAVVAAVCSSPARGRVAMLAAALIVATGAGVWIFAGDAVTHRAAIGRDEVLKYIRTGDASSDTGARLAMARLAIAAAAAHPLAGVGCGGFPTWARTHAPDEATAGAIAGHGHAHNGILHAAATSGLPGAALAIAVMALALFNARRARHDGSSNPYDSGPFWALVGLALASASDSVQVNAQTSALLTTLIALSPSALPRARGRAGSIIGAGP